MVATIEKPKYLSIFFVDELMGSLQAHESRINRSSEKNEEKTLQLKETINNQGENARLASRGRGRVRFHSSHGGRGNRGRGRNDEQKQFNEQRNIRNVILMLPLHKLWSYKS